MCSYAALGFVNRPADVAVSMYQIAVSYAENYGPSHFCGCFNSQRQTTVAVCLCTVEHQLVIKVPTEVYGFFCLLSNGYQGLFPWG
jgi:hypothetical protein